MYGELRFSADNDSGHTTHNTPVVAVKLTPIDSIVQTAKIVTSFARRDLSQLADFEPEGAEYLQRLRGLVDRLAAVPTPIGKPQENEATAELRELASAIQVSLGKAELCFCSPRS